MFFKQYYLGCLAHASYLIGSEGAAAVIDPQRDVTQYLAEADANGLRIKYIIETHSHADFVSGHIELAEKTGAAIIYGQRAHTAFPTLKVKDSDTLTLGKITLTFLETPGHTPEAITILAHSEGQPLRLFTGDTLFIGDVGRPDLIGSKGFTAEQMAAMLYHSLRDKILPLPDETEVYPAHGAGSLCGKSLSKETWSTLGQQRRDNYALQTMTQEEFVEIVAADQPAAPMYFSHSAAKNLAGASPLDALPRPQALTTEQVDNFDGVILDVRVNKDYGAGHIANAVNIGLGGQFASWAGALIPIGTPIALAADTQAQVDEAFMRLARVGHESVKGFILLAHYTGAKKTVEQIPVQKVNELPPDDIQFVDARRAAEHANGHAVNTINLPLDGLSRELDRLNREKPTYVICQSGYRSSVATSLLENAGFTEVYNVTGGTLAWLKAGLPTETSATACANS